LKWIFNLLQKKSDMKLSFKYLSLLSLLMLLQACVNIPVVEQHKSQQAFSVNPKPYARYWWFASEIKREDVRFNLDWLKSHGFGGVELAWVYPLNRFNPADTTYTPRQEWLSHEWQDIVKYTIRYSDSIGLGCDLTLGTLWPFGDSHVTFDQASQRFGEPNWRQVITRSWEHPRSGYVIDHLTPKNYLPYFNRLLDSFPRPGTKLSQSYFIDSWEVETSKLWCDGFDRDFRSSFGYDISPYMDSIYSKTNQRQRYDYMSLISKKVLNFYSGFDSAVNSVGILSRGQVAGAPCDLISGYAKLDIPEGESMLFEPEFCSIPASAALLSGKVNVSSETFTCLYGWPLDYIREEQAADLKLVADALFANGINQIIWHGKAHNPKGQDTVNFYATTHIGDKSKLEPEIKAFNHYLETVSMYMKKGYTYSDIAVYLPTEDAWCAGIMPKEKQFIWSWGYYEMRYVYFPEELDGCNPTWINGEFLDKATVEDGLLKVGNAKYKALYVNTRYLDYKVLTRIEDLAESGLKIIMKNKTEEPGTIVHADYNKVIELLTESKNVSTAVPASLRPFITGNKIPRHWCRKEDNTLYIFFPNPKSDRIKFPLEYGQSLNSATYKTTVAINFQGKVTNLNLTFEPYQSLLYKIENGKAEYIDINYIPPTPVVKNRLKDYKAPWLVR
jgi:hypothetical protein